MPQKTDIITHQQRMAGWSQRTKWKFHKKEDNPQLFRIMQQVTAAQRPGSGVRMLESNRTSTSDCDLGKEAWDFWAQSQPETFRDPKCGEDSRSLTTSNQIKTL